MLSLLKELQENVETPNNETWKVTIAADGSGELIISETPVAIFDNLLELNACVNALLEQTKTLTIALIYEILSEVRL